MSTPAGRPNAQNKVLNEDGTFTTTWYRFQVQLWERSGGSDDGLSDLEEEVNEDVEELQEEVVELNEKVDALEDSVSDIEALPVGGEDEEINDVTPSIIASQPYDDTLAAISETDPTTDQINYFTATNVASVTSLTAFARTLIDDTTQGDMQTTLDVDPAGTDNSTNVTLDGSPNYITIVGQVITRALVNLTSHITGVLGLTNGGTNDAAVTSANIGHLKAMNQNVGTTDDHTMNKSVVNDTTDATSSTTGASQNAGGGSVEKSFFAGEDISVGGFSIMENGGTLAISSGEITATSSFHRVDTSGGSGPEDLDIIRVVGLNKRLILRQANTSRDVRVKDSASLRLAGSVDFDFINANSTLELLSIATDVWVELGRSSN